MYKTSYFIDRWPCEILVYMYITRYCHTQDSQIYTGVSIIIINVTTRLIVLLDIRSLYVIVFYMLYLSYIAQIVEIFKL